MGDRILSRKGQSTLETAVIFVVVILLLAGITKMWLWANNQIVQRQLSYNDSRVQAGTGLNDYKRVGWNYVPPPLREEEVLLGVE